MQIFFVFMGQDPCLLDVERSSLSNGEAFCHERRFTEGRST